MPRYCLYRAALGTTLKILGNFDVPSRSISRSSCLQKNTHYKLVVAGGGSGGCAVANGMASKLGSESVAVVEPAENHYYQPLWTLVGGGVKSLEETKVSTGSVLSSKCVWIKNRVARFYPEKNQLETEDNAIISYDYLVVALGLEVNFHKVPGLHEALMNDERVCSNYSVDFVRKTYPAIDKLQSGRALFTFPSGPIKCPGAPQKIMYLAEELLRERGVRDKVSIGYYTPAERVFGVPRYADVLDVICDERNISVNLRKELVEVRSSTGEALFKDVVSGNVESTQYSLLHVGPPCSAPAVLASSPLSDASGFLDVDSATLQHVTHSNVFGIGDCVNAPTSKTAAAVAAQWGCVSESLQAVMRNETPKSKYDGYTSCPLVTGRSKCILAEFGYDKVIMETFPVNQARESRLAYLLKSYLLPAIYWKLLVRGFWRGPKLVRKILHFGNT